MNLPVLDDVKKAAAEADAQPSNYLRGPKLSAPTKKQLFGTPHKPDVIVDGYLLQDADGFAAPGGMGKSTVALYEAAHIITGRPLYQKRIARSGGVLVISAEDSPEIVYSRMNQVCNPLSLSKKERSLVLHNFFVEDIGATSARLVASTPRDGVYATPLVDEIITKYAGLDLALVLLDPASLLGPGEMSGNDGMAELQRASRRISHELKAATRIISHVAQSIARERIRDQYAPRGGSAFSDNARQLHQLDVLQAPDQKTGLVFEGTTYQLPADISAVDFAKGRVLAIFTHKLSYIERDPTPIVLVRNGFVFRHVPITRRDMSPLAEDCRREQQMERVIDHVRGKLADGKKLTKTDLDASAEALSLTRKELRDALGRALLTLRLAETPLPKDERKTYRTKYLTVVEVNSANSAELRRDRGGEVRTSGEGTAGELRRRSTSKAAAELGGEKRRTRSGTEEAVPSLTPPSAAAKKRLNGKGAAHV
jgi:hypothetical protein